MKKCPKCGTELADDAVFCTACGVRIDEVEDKAPEKEEAPLEKTEEAPAEEPQETPVAEAAPARKDSKAPFDLNAFIATKKVPLIAAAVVVLLIIVLCVSCSGGGYKAVIKENIKLLNSRCTDYTKFNNLTLSPIEIEENDGFHKLMKGAMSKSDYEDYEEDYVLYYSEDYYEDWYDDYEDDFGDDWKITYEIKDVDELKRSRVRDLNDMFEYYADEWEEYTDEDAFEDYLDFIEDEYDAEIKGLDKKLVKFYESLVKKVKKTEIKKAYEVEIKVRIKGEDDHDSETITRILYLVDGKWVMDDYIIDYEY